MNGELAELRYEAFLQEKRAINAPNLGAAATYAATSFATLGLLEIPNPRDSFLKRPQESNDFAFQPEQTIEATERFNVRNHMKDLGHRAITPLGERTITGYASEAPQYFNATSSASLRA